MTAGRQMANSVSKPERATVYLGLGSNLGDRAENLAQAVKRLAQKVVIRGSSSIYETEPVGYEEQPEFLNAVLYGDTGLDPFELLSFIKGVESALGRVPSFSNGPRPIDIDILFYGDGVLRTPALTIPHPRLAERAFVLVPLAEIAPDLVHPLTGKKVSDLLAEAPGRDGVKWAGVIEQREGTEKETGGLKKVAG